MADKQQEAEPQTDYRKQLTGRVRKAVITSVALIVPLCLILVFVGIVFSVYRVTVLEEETVSSLMTAGEDAGADGQWGSQFEENKRMTIDLMSAALREFVTPEGYEGPRVFKDGIVMELRDGEAYYPDDYPADAVRLTREELDDVLADKYLLENEQFAKLDQGSATYPESQDYAYAAAGEIADNIYYVDFTSYSAYADYLELHSRNDDYCRLVERARERVVLVVDKTDPTLELLVPTSYFPDYTHATEIGLTQAMVKRQAGFLANGASSYLVTYKEVPNSDIMVIFLCPSVSPFVHSIMRSFFVVLLVSLIVMMLIVYVASVRSHVQKWPINETQESQYEPSQLMRRVGAAGIAGIVMVFVTATVVHAIGTMHTELLSDETLLNAIVEEAQTVDESGTALAVGEEAWIVSYGERMAELLSQYPQLATNEKLKDLSDGIDARYIMLFDGAGNELACSAPYVGYTLGRGQGENSEDFARLLNGVTSICHEPSLDEVTGENLQFIGVTMPLADSVTNGALIIALKPERIQQVRGSFSIDDQLGFIASKGETLMVTAVAQEEDEAQNGVILHASDESLKGMKLADCGISAESMRDGYMDFVPVNGTPSFLITKSNGSLIYYLAVAESAILSDLTAYGIVAAALFAVVYGSARAIMMGRYAQEYACRVVVDQEIIDELRLHVIESGHDEASEEGKPQSLRTRIRQSYDYAMRHWKAMMPEERTHAVFVTTLFIASIIVLWHELSGASTYSGNDEALLPFILHGNWMRGANLFALCGILLVCGVSFCAIVLLKRLVKLSCSFLDRRDQTITKLMGSFLQYLIVGVAAYFSFDYLGFPTSTILGSLGLGGLALTLGSKDLVADIIAGVSIVFEGGFKIGDIIEVGGFKGTVEDIGVRSTTLRGAGGNVKVIGNRDVKNVLNLSKYNSVYSLDIKIPVEEFDRVEDLLNTELKRIGEKYEDIMRGAPYSRGVVAMSGGTMTLGISVECREKNLGTVGPLLNREIYLLCEREGIKLL